MIKALTAIHTGLLRTIEADESMSEATRHELCVLARIAESQLEQIKLGLVDVAQ